MTKAFFFGGELFRGLKYPGSDPQLKDPNNKFCSANKWMICSTVGLILVYE